MGTLNPKPVQNKQNNVQQIKIEPPQYGPKFENIENMLNEMNTAANEKNLPAVQSIIPQLWEEIKKTEREVQNPSSQEELAKCAANFKQTYPHHCPPATKGGVKKISKKNQQSQKENKSKKKKLSK